MPSAANDDPLADPPTEVDSPEREPVFASDASPPPRTEEEIRALVKEGLPFVGPTSRFVARQLGRLADAAELESVGRATLVEAARTFDASRSSFSTYARKRLRWSMLDSVRRETYGRTAHARALALRAAERVGDALAVDPPDPHQPEAAHARRLGAILSAQAAAMAVGISAPRPGPSAAAPSAEDAEIAFARARARAALERAVAGLPERQRELIERHYWGEERFDHIAESLGISKSWASRLHAMAMEALAKALRDHR